MLMQMRMQRKHSLLLLLLLLQQQCRYRLLCPLQFLYPNEERRARGSKASARPHVRPLTGICKRPASNLLLPQSCSSFRHTAPRPSSLPASSLSTSLLLSSPSFNSTSNPNVCALSLARALSSAYSSHRDLCNAHNHNPSPLPFSLARLYLSLCLLCRL